MRENFLIRFLYGTTAGRAVLKVLTRPGFSRLGGAFLASPFSRVLIPGFIKKNKISLKGIEVPPGGFHSFNAFFKRRKRRSKFDENPYHFINPCDGILSVVKLKANCAFEIKNTRYSLAELLKDNKLAREFEGGYGLVYRLTPKHYHRYSFVDDGIVIASRRIEGILHCVRPIALARYPVFVQNTREYTVIESDNFGKLIQMEIGAIMVGRITNHKLTGRVARGMEKGCFEFGGSTVLVLVKKNVIKFNKNIIKSLISNEEAQVYLGASVAERIDGGNIE